MGIFQCYVSFQGVGGFNFLDVLDVHFKKIGVQMTSFNLTHFFQVLESTSCLHLEFN